MFTGEMFEHRAVRLGQILFVFLGLLLPGWSAAQTKPRVSEFGYQSTIEPQLHYERPEPEDKTWTNIFRVTNLLVKVSLMILMFTTAWRLRASQRARILADVGHSAVTAGNRLAKQGGAKFRTLFGKSHLRGFPGNRGQLKGDAQEVARLMEESAGQFRMAADKYEAACQNSESAVLKESLSLKVQAFRKFSEAKEACRDAAHCVLDDAIQEAEELSRASQMFIDQAHVLGQEAKRLTQQAARPR